MPPPAAPSLYVHVPFRRVPRPYDDAAYTYGSPEAYRQYLSALRREIDEHAAPRLAAPDIASVHIGGGRPSLLPLALVRQLVSALPLPATAPSREVTMEVAPADATPDYLNGLAELGVTRLSLAGLSFSPPVLRALDAPHSAEAVGRTIDAARAAGIDTVALDLVFGLDGLSLGTWNATLRRALALDIPHVSIVEVPSAAPEDTVADHMEHALSVLGAAGYEHYSLSHFARPGRRSAHQEHYDRHGAFLGLGPGAASFRWDDGPDAFPLHARRWANAEALDAYAERIQGGESPAASCDALGPPDLAREYVLIRLQTLEGLSLRILRDRYDLDLRTAAGALLDQLRDANLIHEDPDLVRLTPRGRLLTDALTRRLLSSL